ncbi:MAG TPA: MJ0042-type zinc finger domain-containing protein [Pseudolabrys sp.]|nr:MJ0042-type zinc finger domain-containing protein [Pseudolabrys sp.]
MLLVCPSCATSYMIDAAALGAEGRSVRCARCKTTWFASAADGGGDLNAFVDDVIAEAQAEMKSRPAPAGEPVERTSEYGEVESDDFGADAHTPDEIPQPAVEWGAPGDGFAERPSDIAEVAAEPFPTGEPPAIGDAPPLVPPIDHSEFAESAAPEHTAEDIETFAARRKRLQAKRKKARGSSRWTAIVLLLFAANVALIGARNEVVRYVPQTASLFAAIGLPVNLRGLSFEDVHIAKETQDGMAILLIEGKIVSTTNRTVEVPRLRFAARNASGQEIYSWTAKPERGALGPGESMSFHSRLAAPPADANDVMVRFFAARDAMGK